MSMPISQLNLNSLFHFHVIAKSRSLRLAAEELNLSAPAVTHSLNNLEEALGQPLCIRTRAEFSLTPTGLNLFQTTQKMFDHLEQFSREQENDQDYSGILSIGILDHFEESYFLKAIQLIVTKFPKVKLSIQAFDSDTINELLLNREVDVGLGIFSHQSPRIKYVKVGNEKMKYYISDLNPLWNKKKITKDDLVGQNVVWVDNHFRKRSDLELNIFADNPKYKMKFHGFSNNLSGALCILLSGHAVVPLPEKYGDELTKRFTVKRLNYENKGSELNQFVAFSSTSVLSPPAKMLVEELTKSQIRS